MSIRPLVILPDSKLRLISEPIKEVTNEIRRLADDMLETMYDAPGVGLAAPQVGVQKRLFVYDWGDGPGVLINPEIRESDGEWTFEEGCLSVPGLSWEIIRPKTIHVVGIDLDGNAVDFDLDEYEARVFQHELDHLEGVLLLEHLEEDARREALKILRQRVLDHPTAPPAPGLSLR